MTCLIPTGRTHTRRAAAVLGGALIAAVAALAGCTKAAGAPCTVNSDCDDGLVCNLYSAICSDPALICETDVECRQKGLFYCDDVNVCSFTPRPAAGADAGADTDVAPRPDAAAADITLPDVTSVVFPACPAPAPTMLRATTFAIATKREPQYALDLDDSADPVRGARRQVQTEG